MPKAISEQVWWEYFALREEGYEVAAACARVGISPSSANRLENDPTYNSSGRMAKERWQKSHLPGIKDTDGLRGEAKRALDDFAYFRLRYFGRKSWPWQVAAANEVRRLIESPVKEFAVVNLPPGSGKSVLFTHDIVCWLIARKRSIRIMIGSASESRARQYSEQVLTSLERVSPPPLEEEQEARGAVQAKACMQQDFGRFKPENARRWRAGSFKVAQANDVVGTTKESTVVAVGFDTRYLGDRVDYAIWDDAVTEETTGTPEAREKTLRKWRNEAEKRPDKRGLIVLQGQRISAEDLYHECLELRKFSMDEDIPDDNNRKYNHIVFKAHYDELCSGQHAETDPAYDPFDPESGGCLLDPSGLPYRYLMQEKMDDPRVYATVFQQEDMDPESALVNPLWVNGGEDPNTGEMFMGCWDLWRQAGQIPDIPNSVSCLTVDSSPTQFWSVQQWLYDRETERRILVDLHRARMKVTDALSYNKDTKEWSGLFEEWWQRATAQGHHIGVMIFEAVDAERYFLESRDLQDWASLRGVRVIRHDTHRNKTNPLYGIQSLGPVYRLGRVRLPGDKMSGSYKKSMHLVNEVTRYPESNTTDCLMAQWFLEFNLQAIAPAHVGTYKRAKMPQTVTRRNFSLVKAS